MNKDQSTQMYFELALKKLEKVYQDLKRSHIDFQESEKIKFVQELIKEQVPHEDTRSAAG